MNEANDSKFVKRQWNIVNDNSNTNYGLGNEINYNPEVLKSSFSDHSDAHILVRGGITVATADETHLAFKKFA